MSSSSSFVKVGECLYRNPSSGTYYALVKVRGKQIKRSLETDYLAEARRKLKDFRNDIERVDPNAGRVTVVALADRYLATISHQAPKTVRRKQDIVVRIKAKWPLSIAAEVKKSEILTWLSAFSFGEVSYNLHLECIRAIYALAVEDRLLARSPVDGIKQKKRSRPIRKTPDERDVVAILKSIRQQPFSDTADESADVVEFYAMAGLGRAEAASLRLMDVHLERGDFTTFREKTSTGFVVPIFPQLRPLLERRIAKIFKEANGEIPDPQTKIFTIADPKVAIAAACRRLGLPILSSRAFRRFFITRAIERGVDVKVIALWQGHKDGGKLILDTYSHVRPVHSDRMAKLMV